MRNTGICDTCQNLKTWLLALINGRKRRSYAFLCDMEVKLPEVLYLNFFFLKREAFQSHVCGLVRYRKLCKGKQNHSDIKSGVFFLWGLWEILSTILFLRSVMKFWGEIENTQIHEGIACPTYCCSYWWIVCAFFETSCIKGSLLCSSILSSWFSSSCSWAMIWVHQGCLSTRHKVNFCFRLANFNLLWCSINKPRALVWSVALSLESGVWCYSNEVIYAHLFHVHETHNSTVCVPTKLCMMQLSILQFIWLGFNI